MSVHLNLRNGKIRTDDKEDIVQTAAPAAQETAAQTSADYERQVRLNLKKGTVSYGGKSYGLSHEGTSNAGSQALQERIDARSREQKARTGNIWQAQSQTANRQSTEAWQEETARQKVITMLAAAAARSPRHTSPEPPSCRAVRAARAARQAAICRAAAARAAAPTPPP